MEVKSEVIYMATVSQIVDKPTSGSRYGNATALRGSRICYEPPLFSASQ